VNICTPHAGFCALQATAATASRRGLSEFGQIPGTLVISSQRALFIGNKKTLDLPYGKLVNPWSSAMACSSMSRTAQTAPVFLVPGPDVVAAFVHAAAQRLVA
jgi:hypothetical protein